MSKLYVHYGSSKFNKEAFIPIRNGGMNKPIGGLWASDDTAKYGWRDWNSDSRFRECVESLSFRFILIPEARVLTISCEEQAQEFIFEFSGTTNAMQIDWETVKEYFDAVEVLVSSDYRLYWTLYGWDCDSIVILNPDVIVPIE